MDVARQARRNLGGMPPARVREVLELARVPIASEISRYRLALRRCGSIDEDDLRSLGQIAALEAAHTHDPSRGSELRSWIGFLVRQRITEAMKDAGDAASVEIAFGLPPDFESLTEAYDPIEFERFELANAREWVERSLCGLSPRQKILIAQLLGNVCESFRELSASLGVDKSRVFQDYQVALTALQVRVHRPARVRREELLARLSAPPARREVRQCA